MHLSGPAKRDQGTPKRLIVLVVGQPLHDLLHERLPLLRVVDGHQLVYDVLILRPELFDFYASMVGRHWYLANASMMELFMISFS